MSESLQRSADRAWQRVDELHAAVTAVELQRDELAQLLRATAEHLGMEADVDLAVIPAAAAAAVAETRGLRRQLGVALADRQRLTIALRGVTIAAPELPSITVPAPSSAAAGPPPARPWWQRLVRSRAVAR